MSLLAFALASLLSYLLVTVFTSLISLFTLIPLQPPKLFVTPPRLRPQHGLQNCLWHSGMFLIFFASFLRYTTTASSILVYTYMCIHFFSRHSISSRYTTAIAPSIFSFAVSQLCSCFFLATEAIPQPNLIPMILSLFNSYQPPTRHQLSTQFVKPSH